MSDPDLTAAAAAALKAWDLEPLHIEPVSHSENIVFRVETTDGAGYVLRMHRPGYHSLAELLAEQQWTAALSEAGVDVPVPCPTGIGEPYGQIEVLGETRQVGLLEWVEGRTMRDLMAANDNGGERVLRFRQLGELLAGLHDQASGLAAAQGFRPPYAGCRRPDGYGSVLGPVLAGAGAHPRSA